MKKILIVEDSQEIARFIELELKYEGYEVLISHRGRQGLEMAIDKDIDLIILDLMLPELSGLEILRRLRKEKNIPVILLTAKDDISDKVMGLDSGADDYMTKPFAIEELLARIRARLKQESASSNSYKAGLLSLDNLTYKVMYNEFEINLSRTEFDLLEYLMINKGIVLSRDKILENVWGYEYDGDTNIVDVYIRYLRGKIDQKFNCNLIHTVRGVGYKLEG